MSDDTRSFKNRGKQNVEKWICKPDKNRITVVYVSQSIKRLKECPDEQFKELISHLSVIVQVNFLQNSP